MNTLTFSPKPSADITCPPKDIYTLEVIEIGEFNKKPAFNDPDSINTQSRIEFTIVDFEYDPDEDDRDWNGARVAGFFVFFREYTNKQNERVTSDTWKSDKSKAYELIAALLKRPLEDGEEIDLPEFIGSRVKATVEPKDSGWPKIHRFTPAKKKRAAAAKPVANDPFEDDSAA